MTMDDNQDDYLQVIQQKFLVKLQENHHAFQVFLGKLPNKSYTMSECILLKDIIHQIAGSGKTFGFDEVSVYASKIEERLNILIDNQEDSRGGEGLEIALAALIKISQELIQNNNTKSGVNIEKSKPIEEKIQYQHTILIADDDNLVTELVSNYFKHHNIKVLSASDGQTAMDTIETAHPEIIILDVNLPKIKGFDILKQLKQNADTKDIPVIMLTKMDNDKSVIEGISNGAIEYITKPFEVEKLSSTITSCLQLHEIKILIADDDELICKLLKLRFQKLGYTVITAKNGEEALRLYKESKPRIMILDIMMPSIDGMAVLGQIGDKIPVIMLTAKSQHDNIMSALEKGAYDYITKPFNADELVAKTVGILKRHHKNNG